MKKFIFSAFAVVACAGSSFASNELVSNEQLEQTESEDRPCTIFVTLHNADGTTGTLKREGGKTSLAKCGEIHDAFVLELQEGGIQFDAENDVLLVWG